MTEVLRYREEFRHDIARLLTAFWDDTGIGEAQFSWLVEQNPYCSTPHVYLLLAEGKVVAMRAFHSARWEVVGTRQTFDVPCGTMFAADREQRGRGFGKRLLAEAAQDLASRGIGHLFSFSAGPVTGRIQKKQGWRQATHYRQARRDVSMSRLLRRIPGLRRPTAWIDRRLASASGPGRAFSALDSHASGDFEDGRLAVMLRPDDAMISALASRDRDEGCIRHVRGSEYFEWRYRRPCSEFRFVRWARGNAHGSLVLECQRDHNLPGFVQVIDWQATSDECLRAVFSAILQFGGFRTLQVMRFGLPEGVTDLLEEAGFGDLPDADYPRGLMVKALADPDAAESWQIAGIDLTAPENWSNRGAYLL